MTKLRKMTVQSWRCFESATEIAPFGAVTMFAGDNATGKTSLLDALSMALTGTCRGSEAGRGASQLRTLSSTLSWCVRTEWDTGDNVIELTRREGTGPTSNVQRDTAAALGLPGDPLQIRAALHSYELVRLIRERSGLAAAAKLVSSIASPQGIKIGSATIEELLHALDGDVRGVEFLKDGDRTAGDSRGLQDDHALLTLDQVEAAYQVVYQARRRFGRELRRLEVVEPKLPDDLAGLKKLDLEELEEFAREIEQKVTSLRAERDDLLLSGNQTEVRRSNVEADLERAKARCAELEKQTSNDEARRIKAEATKYTKALSEAREVVENVRAKMGDQLRVVAEAEAKQKDLAEQMREIQHAQVGNQRKCKLCGGALTKAKLDKLLKEVQTAYQASARLLAERKLELDGLRELESEAPDLGTLERKLARVEREDEAFVQAADELSKLRHRRASLETELRQAAEDQAEKRPDCRAQVADLDGRIKVGSERQKAVHGYLAMRRQAARQEKARGVAERRHGVLERLCELLGPKGLRAEVDAGGRLQGFLDRVEATVREFGMPGLDLAPLLAGKGEPESGSRRLSLLSTTELLRVGIGFQAAAARWIELPVMLVDGLELFGPAYQPVVQNALMDLSNQVQVVAAMTYKDREKALAAARDFHEDDPFVAFFVLEPDGRVWRGDS